MFQLLELNGSFGVLIRSQQLGGFAIMEADKVNLDTGLINEVFGNVLQANLGQPADNVQYNRN